MRKLIALATLTSIVAAAAFTGCSDDDENSPTSSSIAPIMVFSGIYLSNSRLAGYIEMWDVTFSGQHVDSIHVGDNIRSTDVESWYWAADDQYWSVRLWDYYDSSYSSGDTVVVRFFDEGEMSEARIKILSNATDSVTFLVEPAAPLAVGVPVQFAWADFPDADFYTVSVNHYYDSAGASRSLSRGWATTDTTFTLPAEYTSHDGNVALRVIPYTGPRPTAEGVVPTNVNGSTVRGQIWSYGYSTYRNYTVGTGKKLNTPPSPTPSETPSDILKRLLTTR